MTKIANKRMIVASNKIDCYSTTPSKKCLQ